MEWVRNDYHKKAAPSSLTAIFSWILGGVHNIFSCVPFYWWREEVTSCSSRNEGAPHSFNHLLVIAAIPRKGRDEGIVRSRSCDESNIVRSRILRTTGSRPRSPLRRTIYRSEELTFSCKSSILLLSKVMLGCFTQVRFARPHDEHVLS